MLCYSRLKTGSVALLNIVGRVTDNDFKTVSQHVRINQIAPALKLIYQGQYNGPVSHTSVCGQ